MTGNLSITKERAMARIVWQRLIEERKIVGSIPLSRDLKSGSRRMSPDLVHHVRLKFWTFKDNHTLQPGHDPSHTAKKVQAYTNRRVACTTKSSCPISFLDGNFVLPSDFRRGCRVEAPRARFVRAVKIPFKPQSCPFCASGRAAFAVGYTSLV